MTVHDRVVRKNWGLDFKEVTLVEERADPAKGRIAKAEILPRCRGSEIFDRVSHRNRRVRF